VAIYSIIENVRDRRPGKGRPFGPPLARLKALTGAALPKKGIDRMNGTPKPSRSAQAMPSQTPAQSWGWSNGGELPG
jgi:hypothetical protein